MSAFNKYVDLLRKNSLIILLVISLLTNLYLFGSLAKSIDLHYVSSQPSELAASICQTINSKGNIDEARCEIYFLRFRATNPVLQDNEYSELGFSDMQIQRCASAIRNLSDSYADISNENDFIYGLKAIPEKIIFKKENILDIEEIDYTKLRCIMTLEAD